MLIDLHFQFLPRDHLIYSDWSYWSLPPDFFHIPLCRSKSSHNSTVMQMKKHCRIIRPSQIPGPLYISLQWQSWIKYINHEGCSIHKPGFDKLSVYNRRHTKRRHCTHACSVTATVITNGCIRGESASSRLFSSPRWNFILRKTCIYQGKIKLRYSKTLLHVSGHIKHPELRKSQNRRCRVEFSISASTTGQSKAISSDHHN
jgi:hypothetical protein